MNGVQVLPDSYHREYFGFDAMRTTKKLPKKDKNRRGTSSQTTFRHKNGPIENVVKSQKQFGPIFPDMAPLTDGAKNLKKHFKSVKMGRVCVVVSWAQISGVNGF